MRHLLTAFLVLLLCASCHDELELPKTTWKRVVVVYIMGENSLSTYAQRDLNEIRSAMKTIPDSCQLVVFFDNSRNNEYPQILTFDKSGEKTLFAYKTDPLSTDSATLRQVLRTVTKESPADQYGLVMWSHGSGWLPQQPRYSIGVDNGKNSFSNIGTEMEIPTLANILRQSGERWTYVFFDACFMQTIEVAYELRDCVDWCIASPAEIPAEGAPYDEMLPTLFDDQPWRIAEAYYDFYKTRGGIVISALRTSEMEQLATATAPLIARLPSYPTTEGVQQYFALEYPEQWEPEFFDMGSAIHAWFDSDYQAWLETARKAVPYRFATQQWETAYPEFYNPTLTDEANILGVSMYIPTEGGRQNEAFKRTSWCKRVGWK